MNKVTIGIAGCVVALIAAGSWMAFAPSRPSTFKDRADAVASSLRCPVCESLSVKDSTADVAQEMRAQIEAGLREGRSPDEIKTSFVAAYGETVLLSPEPEGVNLIAWVVPALALLGGAMLAVAIVRRWTVAGGGA